jgi:HEAT repeat protein
VTAAPTTLATTVTLLATFVVFAAGAVLAVVLVLTKLGRDRRARRRAALVAPLRRHLIAVSAGEDDGTSRAALAAADGPARHAVIGAVSELLGKVRGLPAEQLVEVLDRHGALASAMTDLHHASPVRRARAAQLLGVSRVPDAVDPLVEALGDKASEVRASAAYALGLIGDPRAAAPLLRAVGAPRAGLPAGLAADALLGMGVGISGALGDALADPDPRTRTVAAHLCGVGSFTRAVPSLRERLAHDPDLTVRETCAQALGRIGRADDVEVLTRHTEAVHPLPLRRVCAEALGALGEDAAVPTLAALLRDPDPRLAELAATSLVRLGPCGRAALAAAADERPVQAALAVAGLQGVLR